MTPGTSAPARVVVGDFGAIARHGMSDALRSQGFEVLVYELADVEAHIDLVRPLAIVLDGDLESCRLLATRIAVEHPEIRVITCSVDEPSMRVYSDDSGPEPDPVPLTAALLAAAIREKP
jgi:hypothetical protein